MKERVPKSLHPSAHMYVQYVSVYLYISVFIFVCICLVTKPPGSDIGGDQYGGARVPELLQHVVAVLLVLVAVYSQGPPPGAVYCFCYVVHLKEIKVKH